MQHMKYDSSALDKLLNGYRFFALVTGTSSALNLLIDKILMIFFMM